MTNLTPSTGNGWLSGFGNMLRMENGKWWGTRQWLTQALYWLLAVNGIVAMPLLVAPIMDPGATISVMSGLDIFMPIMAMVAAFGVVIVMQSAIVGEKQSGTAAWVLSSPITRSAFILSKLVANALGLFFVAIVVQGVVGYGITSYYGGAALPVASFAISMGLQALHMVFYITLAVMLGSFFNSRGPVLGIVIGLAAGQDIIGQIVGAILPWFPLLLPNRIHEIALMVATGQTPTTYIPLVSGLLLSAVFVVVAIWRFKRTEF